MASGEWADHALFKKVRYVLLRPLRTELDGQDVEVLIVLSPYSLIVLRNGPHDHTQMECRLKANSNVSPSQAVNKGSPSYSMILKFQNLQISVNNLFEIFCNYFHQI
jgi:hypothetical protein